MYGHRNGFVWFLSALALGACGSPPETYFKTKSSTMQAAEVKLGGTPRALQTDIGKLSIYPIADLSTSEGPIRMTLTGAAVREKTVIIKTIQTMAVSHYVSGKQRIPFANAFSYLRRLHARWTRVVILQNADIDTIKSRMDEKMKSQMPFPMESLEQLFPQGFKEGEELGVLWTTLNGKDELSFRSPYSQIEGKPEDGPKLWQKLSTPQQDEDQLRTQMQMFSYPLGGPY